VTAPAEGLLLVDKPAGPTSHDIVGVVRAALGERRVGHTGTLDPQATGLLALVVGRATRLARFVPSSPKRYAGTIRLGVTTTTDDAAGEVTSRHEGPLPDPSAIAVAARALTGRGLQTPPAVSARQVGGVRLYRLARSGVPVVAAATEVVVHRFDLGPTEDASILAFEAEVSAGTYVRSLARDLGAALGCGAVVLTLRRIAIGPLTVDRAAALTSSGAPPAEVLRAALIPLSAMPLDVQSFTIASEDDRRLFTAGRPVLRGPDPAASDPVAVRDRSGAILGIGLIDGDWVRPHVVLASADVAPQGAV
jgi:tRNA pseudouridine55 synthase